MDKAYRTLISFPQDKKEELKALAKKRGYNTLSRYIRELVLKDLECSEK